MGEVSVWCIYNDAVDTSVRKFRMYYRSVLKLCRLFMLSLTRIPKLKTLFSSDMR
ncbi:MAG: hypothetical protein IPN18_11425 [Ignavibacteriales bacterium]|nr:hypothetical protein [Ignavibacteriales bacterium]